MQKKVTYFFTPLLIFFFCSTYAVGLKHPPKQNNTVKFTENKNQWDPRILYGAQLDGGFLFLEKNCFTYNFYDKETLRKSHAHHGTETANEDIRTHAFRMTFLNALTNPVATPSEKTPDYSNFFIGKDKRKWASDVRNYKELNYSGLYDGVRLQVLGMENSMKYNFIVSPEGAPNDIRLFYEGLNKIFLEDGALKMVTSINEIMEQKPYAYQIINGKEVEVKCEFVLEGTTVRFHFPRGYKKNIELIIDPVLVFACSSGSIADNFGMTATYDDAGNLYAGGTVFGIGYPTTLGAYDSTWSGIPTYVYGRTDVVITKYDSSGTFLQYSTYLGGSTGTEIVSSLIVNSQNQLMLFGATGSSDFPVTATAYDTTFNAGDSLFFVANGTKYVNGTDLYICKFNLTGTSLLASTYVGGTKNDGANNSPQLAYNYGDYYRGEIQTDNAGNFYIGSCTYSTDFPVTPGCFQPTSGGGMDGVLFKMDPNLTTMIWSTYLGGLADDGCYAITVDNSQNVYTTGGTNSPNFPVTGGVFSSTYNGGRSDGYVTKLRNDGAVIMNSTFIGTNQYDQAYLIQLDNNADVYIVGQSEGVMPVSPGVYSNPNSKQFIWKMNASFNFLMFSTVIGNGNGQVNFAPSAFLVDICGNIYICGWGGNILLGIPTTGMPITSDAYQSTTDGFNFYLMVLTPNANSLLYGTYFGGALSQEHVDGGTSRFDKKGIVYQAVCANCGGGSPASQHDDFPVTPGSWPNTGADVNHNTQNYNCNMGVFKFDFQVSGVSAEASIFPNDTICPGDTAVFNNASANALNYLWNFGDGSPTSQAVAPVHSYLNPGTYSVSLIAFDSTGCISSDTSYLSVTVAPVPVVNLGNDVISCQQPNQVLNAGTSGNIYSWSTGMTSQTITAVDTGSYWVEVSNGHCDARDSIHISQASFPTYVHDTTVCTGQAITFDMYAPGASYAWSNGSSADSITVSSGNQYWVTITIATCIEIDTMNIHHIPYPVNSLPTDLSLCPNGTLTLNGGAPATNWLWSTGDTTQSITIDSIGAYTVTSSNFQCSQTSVTTVSPVIFPPPLRDTTVCTGQFLLVGHSAPGAAYLWSTGAQTPIINVTSAGQYDVEITIGACLEKDTINVSYLPFPVVNLPAILNGCPHNAVILDAGSPADSYLWSTGDTTQTISVTNQGLYIVTASNANCSTRDSTQMNIYPDITWEENATLCNVDKYTLDPGISNATYYWSTGETTPTIDVTESGVYWVIANSNGCFLSDTITINGNISNGALWFPNSFTPNSNGLNDSFTGIGSDITYFDLMIFNRWGDLIFETDKQQVGWDGMYKGRLAEQDVYVWKVKYKTLCSNDQLITKIGHVTLIQ